MVLFNIYGADSAWFPSISQLELRVDAVDAPSRHRDALRESRGSFASVRGPRRRLAQDHLELHGLL